MAPEEGPTTEDLISQMDQEEDGRPVSPKPEEDIEPYLEATEVDTP